MSPIYHLGHALLVPFQNTQFLKAITSCSVTIGGCQPIRVTGASFPWGGYLERPSSRPTCRAQMLHVQAPFSASKTARAVPLSPSRHSICSYYHPFCHPQEERRHMTDT